MATLLFITTKKTWGGSEPLWCDTAERALAVGHRVTIAMPTPEKLHSRHEKLAEMGAKIIFKAPWAKPTLLRRVVLKLRRIKRPEAKWWRDHLPEKTDAICISQGGTYCAMNMPGLVPWLFDSGIPYLLVCQSNRAYALPSFQMRRDIQGLFRNAFKICFVAEENARAAARFLAMDLPNAAVVQNPVNLRDTGIVPWSGDTKFRLACVARFEIRDKGQDLLLEALSRPAWKERDFELSFFGNGPDGEIIQDLIGHYGLGEKVRVAGFEPDIRKVWAAHQMLVLPSLSEGTPLSLIEAQVCGRPALVTRVDGNPDWVEEGKTGFLAEAPTVYHLRAALDRAWDKRYFWHEMGKAARDVCMAKRDPDHAGTLLKMLDMAASRTKTES